MNATTGHADIVMVAVAGIIIPPERRALVREPVVEMLMASIERRGLLSPVRLRQTTNALVCGLHRVIAHERLDRLEIPAIFCEGSDADIELDEIEENLARKELTVLERARQELRQKELYETLHPEAKRGVAGARARHGVQAKALSFADAQAKAGDGKRMHQQRVQIAESIGADADRLVDHPIANNHTQLLELARVPDAVRALAVDLLATGRANSVRAAVAQLGTEPKPPHPPPPSPVSVSCPVVLERDGYVALVDVAGRRMRVCYATTLDRCSVEDKGRVPVPRPVPRQDTRTLDLANSLVVPDEVVAELPADLAAHVTISPLYVDDHCKCERCGSTQVRGEVDYLCAQCATKSRLTAHRLADAPVRNIRCPRIVREVAFRGSGVRPWDRHLVVWWSGADRLPTAPVDSVYIEHWASSSERWRILLEPAQPHTVEIFKMQLREAILGLLCDRDVLRRAGDRYLRDDGSEVVLVPGGPLTQLPAVVARSGLRREEHLTTSLTHTREVPCTAPRV